MLPLSRAVGFPLLLLNGCPTMAAEIERIWLTHGQNTPETVVVNWETAEEGGSVVEFGETRDLGKRVESAEKARLHHVEIPFSARGVHYRVRTGKLASDVHFVRGHDAELLRVAIIGDVGYAKTDWGAAILREKPDLLMTAGDNVGALHKGTPVEVGTTAAFNELIGGWPELFRTTRFMPVLGNHDREIRPRGPQPPPEAVYDVEATAFRSYFALPEPEWRWHFDVPAFGVRFVALDLNHVRDMGTTWQTCHSFAEDGPQFGWYRDLMAASRHPFVVTINNEKSSTARGLEKGEWGKLISQGSMAATGFGYFGERAEVDGFPYFNTSVSGTGAQYRDPKAVAFESRDNYLLLQFQREPAKLIVEMKALDGVVLDRREIAPRSRAR